MTLTAQNKKLLRKLGHNLNPVVMIADQGLKATVIDATNEALKAHELIKVRIRTDGKSQRTSITEDLSHQTGAELISLVGGIALLFKRNKKHPKVEF